MQSWNKVLIKTDTNKPIIFLEDFLELYDTCIKINNTCKNRRYKKPWLTKGLLNACKTKNNLYKQFIKNKTKINEIKHKMYKNNLVNILQNCKQTYYNKLVEENKNYNKKSWKIINEVMRNKKNCQTYPLELT